MKVLIVDDSSVTRKIIRAVTDALELEMCEAGDGTEAFEVLAERYGEIGLVLLDWNMPGMSGFDVLSGMKANSKYKDIPVMMVTTEGQQGSIVAAIRAGAVNYLTKPFTAEELETKIRECIGLEGF